MGTRFMNTGPNCCCCDFVFYGPGGNAAPVTLTSCQILYINQNKSNHWKVAAQTTGLPSSSGSSPTCLDQINKQVFTCHPHPTFLGLGVTICRTDIEQAISEHILNKVNWNLNLVYFQPQLVPGTSYFITSMALNKRAGNVIFVQRKIVTAPSSVTFEVYNIGYFGAGLTHITDLTGLPVGSTTGHSIWHPGLLSYYVVAKTPNPSGNNIIKMVTALGETDIYTVPRSSQEDVWGLSVDLEHGKLWWLEYNQTAITASGTVRIQSSDLFGGGVTTVASFPGHFINTIQRSYKKNKMIFFKAKASTLGANDPGNGLFQADLDLSNQELIYDRSKGFNDGTNQFQAFNDNLMMELYCGWEFTGAGYPGA